jgi:hypothetical protein
LTSPGFGFAHRPQRHTRSPARVIRQAEHQHPCVRSHHQRGRFAGGSSQEPSRAEAHLVRLGYSRDFARAYAESLGAVGFPTTFRVSTWAIAWDADGGGESPFMQVSGELMNYVEARMDREAPEGEEPELSEPAVQPVAVRSE